MKTPINDHAPIPSGPVVGFAIQVCSSILSEYERCLGETVGSIPGKTGRVTGGLAWRSSAGADCLQIPVDCCHRADFLVLLETAGAAIFTPEPENNGLAWPLDKGITHPKAEHSLRA